MRFFELVAPQYLYVIKCYRILYFTVKVQNVSVIKINLVYNVLREYKTIQFFFRNMES